MKIAIYDGLTFDSNVHPIAVILNDADKRNITDMAPDAAVYASFPDTTNPVHMERWVEELKRDHAQANPEP